MPSLETGSTNPSYCKIYWTTTAMTGCVCTVTVGQAFYGHSSIGGDVKNTVPLLLLVVFLLLPALHFIWHWLGCVGLEGVGGERAQPTPSPGSLLLPCTASQFLVPR